MNEKIVIALGGNALQSGNAAATAEAQLEVVKMTAEKIAEISSKGCEIAVVHGNGPQVGRILLASETAKDITPPMPFDVCGAMSQGYIGYHLQQCIKYALNKANRNIPVVTVATQMVVEKNDPAFKNPTKPIGPFYSREEAERLAAEKGYIVKEDSGRGWRRVVASPKPVSIIELETIRCLLDNGVIVIAAGGGGIPVVKDENGILHGKEAVIDKDLAAAMLAKDLKADLFVISTAVPKVCINFGKPNEKKLDSITTEEAKKYMEEGHFAPGSMLPKIQAIVDFVDSTGNVGIVTDPEHLYEAVYGEQGTKIEG